VHTVALGGDLTYLTWSRDGEDLLVGSIVWTLITVGCELELLS
jgi:hypothetical protein